MKCGQCATRVRNTYYETDGDYVLCPDCAVGDGSTLRLVAVFKRYCQIQAEAQAGRELEWVENFEGLEFVISDVHKAKALADRIIEKLPLWGSLEIRSARVLLRKFSQICWFTNLRVIRMVRLGRG